MILAIKRAVIVILGVLLQFGFEIITVLLFSEYIAIINIIYRLISVLIVLAIIKYSTRISNYLPWIILILIFPIFGTVLLITLGRSYSKNKLFKNILQKESEYEKFYIQDETIKKEIESKNLDELKYIMNYAKYPISKNNEITYYKCGEEFFPELLKELKKAKKFIFMEYFIINKGTMWNQILDILKEKASEGIDIRVMYDDMGSIAMLPDNYGNELEKYGIKCILFNKLSPFRGIFMNNRDHRKMTIIDGKVAFSGGVNISDEYINLTHPHGYWKDNGIKIIGDAIWNLTIMFLTMWNANIDEDKDITKFKYQFPKNKDLGYVSAYGSAPLHKDIIGEDIYLNMINGAKKYLYILTPYLIIDTDVINSLTRAAKRGVDVAIVVPGIPDKKIVYFMSSSYFEILINAGVKIYTYTPGFVHSKVFVCDDIKATVGTLNLDYRSLYLHFENGIYLENHKEITKIKEDVVNTITSSHQVTKKEAKPNFFKSILQAILRIIAPMF